MDRTTTAPNGQGAPCTFGEITGMVEAGEDHETMLGDLLTDLMPWCDRNGVDFDSKLQGAIVNYNEETRA